MGLLSVFGSLFGSKKSPNTSASTSSLNDVQLLLLSKFLHGGASSYVPAHQWSGPLGRPVSNVLSSFQESGILVQAPLLIRVQHLQAKELKDFAKRFGLKSSGRKEELAARLADSCPEEMETAVPAGTIWICSTEVTPRVEEFLHREEKAKATAEQESLSALTRGDLNSASRIVRAYESKRIFGRGLNVDWRQQDQGEELVLRTIFSAKPGILSDVMPDALPILRIAAGMMSLWGVNQAHQWLPEGFNSGSRLDDDTSARMLVFAGCQQRDLSSYKVAGVKSVEILGSGESCPACLKSSKKRYSLKNCPELPNPGCTHEMGCRCTTIAIS